jgi:hypothetical protein
MKMGEVVYQVKKVSVYGDKVILSNGSQWLISPDYVSKCVSWYETQRIIIKEINSELSQYQLVNVDTADIAEAHVVSGYP